QRHELRAWNVTEFTHPFVRTPDINDADLVFFITKFFRRNFQYVRQSGIGRRVEFDEFSCHLLTSLKCATILAGDVTKSYFHGAFAQPSRSAPAIRGARQCVSDRRGG